MKKHLLKFFMLALCLTLGFPLAHAADQTTIDGITLYEKWNLSQSKGNLTSSYFGNETLRDAAFWNGELIVLTKNTKLRRINVATGELIGEMSVEGISGGALSGGALSMSSIAVCKGKLFMCNYPSASSTVWIYRWDTPTSKPVKANGNGNIMSEGPQNNVGCKMTTFNDMLWFCNSQYLYSFNVDNNGNVSWGTTLKFTYSDGKSEFPLGYDNDGTAVAVVPSQSTNSARYNIFSAYDSQPLAVKENMGSFMQSTGNISIEGTPLVNPTRSSAGQVINYNGKKFMALVDYNDANSNRNGVLKLLTKQSDVKYTYSGNQLPSQPLGNATNSDLVAAVEYQVRADNTLDIVLVVPNQGIAMFSTLKDEAPVEPKNLTASNSWLADNSGQAVNFKWTGGQRVNHYTLERAKDANGKPQDGSSQILARNISGGASSYTYQPLTSGTGYQPLYILRAWADAKDYDAADNNKEVGKCIGTRLYARAWYLDFGAINLKGEVDGSTAKLTWNAPAHGTVKEYQVYKVETVNGESTANLLGTTTATNYDVANHQTEGTNLASYVVQAVMNQSVTTKDGEIRNTVKSNVVVPTLIGKPTITAIRTYAGRTTATLEWTYDGVGNVYAAFYEVYRNGQLIQNNYESGKLSDMNLADGTYSYYVVAHLKDKTTDADCGTMKSNTVSCTIERNRLVTGYGLDVVYNYPIYTPAEYSAKGSPDASVVAKGIFANAKTKVGAWGAPGDAYRQAQFYNGDWYIACLTTRDANSEGYIPNAWDNTPINTATPDFGGAKAGVLRIPARSLNGRADDPRILETIGWDQACVNGTWPLENQSVALTEDGQVYRRGLGAPSQLDNKGTSGQLFYLPWTYINYGSGNIDITGQNLISKWTAEQSYRTHYISASGKHADNTTKVLMAMNYTRQVYRVSKNGAVEIFTAPDTDGKGTCTSTENYAFPIVGRPNAFIHQVRGEGVYYVDANTKEYTLIYFEETDRNNSGGVTFKYNDELFMLHPTSTRSNNVGHFSIDMIDRQGGDIDLASFENMIPVASFSQQGMTEFVAGNSNASWYGAEYDANDDCIYLYQYVPGVRFAKYRFYKYISYPGTTPTLEINVKANPKKNGTGMEVDYLAAHANWPRPADEEGYKPGELNTEWLIGEYEVNFRDEKSTNVGNGEKPGFQWGHKHDKVDGQHNPWDAPKDTKYDRFFGTQDNDWGDRGNKYDRGIREATYSVEVTPVYYKRADHNAPKVKGQPGVATAMASYPVAINPLTVTAYTGVGAAQGQYRVDFDFNRADLKGGYPDPVSYFTIEVSKDGGNSWQQLVHPTFHFMWFNHAEKAEWHSDFTFDNGSANNANAVELFSIIPGDYRFGPGYGEEDMVTRYNYEENTGIKNPNHPSNRAMKYANANDQTMKDYELYANVSSYKMSVEPDGNPVVAFYYPETDPSNLRYRAVAHYAANNAVIHKDAYTEAAAPVNGSTTGVTGVESDNNGQLMVYPVPAETTISVLAPEAINSVKVFSLSGAVVLAEEGLGQNVQTVNVSSLPAGVYMVTVNSLAPVRMIKR